MADVRLTPQDLTDVAVTTTRTAIATGNTYQVRMPSGGAVLNWRKTGAGNATITITTPGTVNGLAIADRTLTVAATTGDMIGIFKGSAYRNSDGDLEFTTDEGTGLTCAVGKGLG
tara:strand:- start:615 stop:959 length:345 start_codon:yes stop_codon:yes gene_type:complete